MSTVATPPTVTPPLLHCLRQGIAGVAMITLAACGSSGGAGSPTAPGASVSTVVVTSASTGAAFFRLTASARMSDGTVRDVTNAATWESSNPLLAAVSSTGMVTVVGSGEVDVRATYQNVTGTLRLSVTTLAVAAVTVSGAPSVASSPFQLTATARFSDGSTPDVTRSATWESSNVQLASVSSSGYVTILGNGAVDLKATYQGVTGAAHVNVSLPGTLTMSGVVAEIAPNIRPLAGVRVQIVGGDHTLSDDRGAFAIPGVAPGRMLIEFTKDGYQIYETEIVFVDGNTLSVSLYPTPPKSADGASATARCNDGSWSWAQTRTNACAANGGLAYTVCPGTLCTP
jgi:hypothetical protein